MDEVRYFRIKNWQKFQHYKHRNPPWIKLYQGLLDDYDFCNLDERSQLLLLKLWILAARVNNKLRANVDWLKFQLKLSGNIDLKPLIDAGYIEYESASNVLATCMQSAPSETETETETEHPAKIFLKNRDPALTESFKTLIDYWNSKPELKSYAEAKKPRNPKKWYNALQSGDSIEEFWKPCIDVMASDDFYRGQAKLTLDWLITSGKADQVFAKKGNNNARVKTHPARAIR